MDRHPAVAGRFYSDDPAALRRELDRFLAPAGDKIRCVAVVSPHAGYLYSGAIAGAVFARVAVPPHAIVLGPNHTGVGDDVALWPGGRWRLPSGDVTIDPALTAALGGSPLVSTDVGAHLHEHSLEVQVPFLAHERPDVTIAALCLGHLSFADCEALGRHVARAAAAAGALVVASSDMSHYIPAAKAREKDLRAVDHILALDPEGLYDTVRRERITMCGVIPVTVMLVAAREMGATRAELVRYGHSGEVNGDERQVVGYAGVIVA